MSEGEFFNPGMFIQAERHHIWCNYFYRDPRDCEMCKGMFERYPYHDNERCCILTPDEMLAKYFPDVKRVR